jgi:two-component system, LytTR family, sensor kinase
MTLRPSIRAALLVTGALAVCAALALRNTAVLFVAERLDPRFRVGVEKEAVWYVMYYLMWAALTPLIFFLGQVVRFRRDSWLRPLAFHAGISVVVAAVAPTGLAILFGALVLGRGWPDPRELLLPFWTRYAAFRAVADTSLYWLILAAGNALRVYDETQARRLQAADLERSLVAAQVDVLKMKLQPHFLFNTLNSIGFLALEKNSTAVVTMVERLANLLRASMQAGSQLVPLEEEMALVDEYLAIEEMRFGDRLHVVRRVDPATARACVPSLILQPIVENSIKHGLSQRLDASRLEIAAFREQDALHIVVGDDGPGLPPGWDLATHCGRGLQNVMERLDALYRGAWSLSLKGGEAGGTIADLRIPYTESSELFTTAAIPVSTGGLAIEDASQRTI